MRKPDPDPAARPRRRQSSNVALRQAGRREEVAAAAQQLVAERGLEALTAASLAQALGVVPAALYRTYPSMDALKGELVARALDRLAVALQASVARVKGLARVRAVAGALPSLRARAPADHALIDHVLSSLRPVFSDEVALSVEPHLRGVLQVAERVLEEAVDGGALAPGHAGRRALALLALAHGADHLVKRDRLEPRERHADRVYDEAVDALLRGWAR